MEEDIKILEKKLKQWEPYKNTKFPTPIEKEIQKENRAIENLINKNKELEKMVELMNEFILKNCVSGEICATSKKDCYIDIIYGDDCRECVKNYFVEKAKGE